MNKLRNAFLILSASAFLASCGSPAPEASSSSAAVSSATSSASQPAASSEPGSSTKSAESSSAASTQDFPDNVTISFWSTGSQGMNDTLTELVDVFEKAIKDNTGKTVHVDLSVEGGYDDIENKLITGLSDGTLPNMAVAYPDTVANIIAQEPANKEYLYDISSYLEDDTVGFGKQSYLGDTASADKEDIVPAFLDEGTHYSRPGMYSYPFMKSTEVMFYMKDYVESAYKFFRPEIQGAENIHDDLSNMTWAEFETLLTSVMEHKDAINDQLQTAAWYDSDSNWFISHCYQRGINYSSIENGKGKIGFESGVDRTDAEAMLEDFKSLYDDQRITTKGIENKYGSDAFKNEWTLFSIGSSGGTGYQMPQGATPDEIGVVPVPAADGNQAYVSQGVCRR